MNKTLATLAAAGLALTATAAQAENVNVTYSDLNLSTVAGQKELSQRIERAARSVCGVDAPRTGSRLPDSAARSCFEMAKARAGEQVAARVDEQAMGG
jgi:UrcA family protein